MALESADYISQLDITNPAGADKYSTVDNQIRLTKKAAKQSFPNVGSPVTASAGAMNLLVGVSANLQTQLNNLYNDIHSASAALMVDIDTTSANLSAEIHAASGNLSAQIATLSSTLNTQIINTSAALSAQIASAQAALNATISSLSATFDTDIESSVAALGVDIATTSAALSTQIHTTSANLDTKIETLSATLNANKLGVDTTAVAANNWGAYGKYIQTATPVMAANTIWFQPEA